MKKSELNYNYFVIKEGDKFKIKASFLHKIDGSIYTASSRKIAEDYIKCIKHGSQPKELQ